MTDEQRRRGPAATQVEATGSHVRANVVRLRKARGLTTYQLAQRMAEAGRAIPQSGISRIEAGTRRVDVDDLTALASVLGVSPVTLLLPAERPAGARDDARSEWVQVTGSPGGMPWESAWRWMHGELPPADVPVREIRRFREENRPYEDENPAREVEVLLRSRLEGAWHLEIDHDETGATVAKLTRRSGGTDG